MLRVFVFALISCVALSIVPRADAAPIEWSIVDVTGTNGVGDAAVSTNGTLVEAVNFGGGTVVDTTVNTVTFTGVDVTNSEAPTNLTGLGYEDAQNGNGESGIGAIDVMFDTIGFDANVGSHTAALVGLTDGLKYEVQFFLSHTNTASRSQRIADGEGNSIDMKNADPSQAVTGTFTAVGTSQAVTFQNLNSGSQLLSGYQLRLVPEPSSLALLFAGGLLIARRRRV